MQQLFFSTLVLVALSACANREITRQEYQEMKRQQPYNGPIIYKYEPNYRPQH